MYPVRISLITFWLIQYFLKHQVIVVWYFISVISHNKVQQLAAKKTSRFRKYPWVKIWHESKWRCQNEAANKSISSESQKTGMNFTCSFISLLLPLLNVVNKDFSENKDDSHVVSSDNVQPQHHLLHPLTGAEHSFMTLIQDQVDGLIEALQSALKTPQDQL